MASIKAPDNLPLIVKEKFYAAKEASDLNFYPTQLAIQHCGESRIPFQVRFSPALANKPKSNKPHEAKKPIDPFLDPPEGLVVCDIHPSHFIVLNKFAIVPEHFILATKEFKEQTHLLEKDDLAAAYACVKAYRDHGKLFAFFNSGEYSGASQPHRHIQFLPVKSMLEGMHSEEDWRPLAESLVSVGPTQESELPFAYFASELSKDPSATELHQTYKSLHENSCLAVQSFLAERPGHDLQLQSNQGGLSPISYNMGLTDNTMVLCPRISEGKIIQSKGGDYVGPIALNGTLLAGTLLVKSEAEWDALRDDEAKLTSILGAIGIPPAVRQNDGKL